MYLRLYPMTSAEVIYLPVVNCAIRRGCGTHQPVLVLSNRKEFWGFRAIWWGRRASGKSRMAPHGCAPNRHWAFAGEALAIGISRGRAEALRTRIESIFKDHFESPLARTVLDDEWMVGQPPTAIDASAAQGCRSCRPLVDQNRSVAE